ncbi:MAG: glycosyltransferase family 2 protein, partial [Deltaproteobacteria bacterium]|nr:glycosyltransferase family 2 protein [Deltaproteobacteria bacterium]
DIVIGARDLPESYCIHKLSRARKIAGRTFSGISDALLKINIKDSQCGIKGFTGNTAKKIFKKLTISGYAFDVEILALARQLNLNIQKVPVTLVQKQHSKVRLIPDSLLMLRDVLRLYVRQRSA